MPRNVSTVVENNFSRGLVTEGTVLNFPQNACTATENCIFDYTGKVSRRKGFDLEEGYTWRDITLDDGVFFEYVWVVAGGSSDFSFLVQQLGDKIHFYRLENHTPASFEKIAFVIDLDNFAVSGAPATKDRVAGFSTGKGYLFISHPYCTSLYISYDNSSGMFTTNEINLLIRDFEGLVDGLENDERPTVLSKEHHYNLRNQGWTTAVVPTGGGLYSPLTYWSLVTSDFPSNSDVWWTLKDSTDTLERLNFNKQTYGKSPAPKGYYTLNPFDTNRFSVSGITGLTDRSSSFYRPSCNAFFAGRVFYSGVEYSDYTGEIWFSKTVEGPADFGVCHQINDPTSEALSDILATDGGVIKILEAGKIQALFATQKALLVFASNGVWAISGSEVSSFKADDYVIKRIATLNVTSSMSLVDVLGVPIFLNVDGVWTISFEQGEFTLRNISDESIKTYLGGFSYVSKEFSKGVYNKDRKVVQWLLNSGTPETTTEKFTYDTILNMDTRTGAFYPFKITHPTLTIKGLFTKYALVDTELDVILDGVDTVVDGVDSIVSYSTTRASFFDTTKFTTIYNVSGTSYKLTYSDERDEDYEDFASYGTAVLYNSTFTSGYKVDGQGNKEFQANYLTLVIENLTGAGATVQGIWDYTTSASSLKWTTAQQLYNTSPTFRSYITRRLKIRGWGKSLQFRVASEDNKPFSIAGFITQESGNAST